MIADYLLTLVVIYAAMLAVYFGFGLMAEAYATRFPERKIQPERDGTKRKRKEILNSLPALAMSSFLLGTGYFAQMQGWTFLDVDNANQFPNCREMVGIDSEDQRFSYALAKTEPRVRVANLITCPRIMFAVFVPLGMLRSEVAGH